MQEKVSSELLQLICVSFGLQKPDDQVLISHGYPKINVFTNSRVKFVLEASSNWNNIQVN